MTDYIIIYVYNLKEFNIRLDLRFNYIYIMLYYQ